MIFYLDRCGVAHMAWMVVSRLNFVGDNTAEAWDVIEGWIYKAICLYVFRNQIKKNTCPLLYLSQSST